MIKRLISKLKNPEISVAQFVRSHTHIKHFRQATCRPRQAQSAQLLSFIKENSNTAYGRKHGFDKIRSIEDYQRAVPPNQYEDLLPYIEAVMSGGKRQLSAQEPFMFATTSGTTAKPKFIPITENHLRDYTHAFQVHNYYMIADYPGGAIGKYMVLTSNDQEGVVASGKPYGAVSGLLNKRQPDVVRQHFALPYEICKVRDVDTKYYLMLRCSLVQNVTGIIGCNPSSYLLLADQLAEHAEELIKDIRDGSIKQCYSPPIAYADKFKKYLMPDPDRANQLMQILETHGSLLPRLVWPNLDAVSCWKGGPMSFYLEQLEEFYGKLYIRDLGYMASEGRGSIPISNDGAAGVVALTSHFFEFVPEAEVDKPNPTFLTVEQLEVGRRYYIYFTTRAGLYRYNINDLVEVCGFYNNTPTIQFVRKGMGISSITGEKLTEDQVRVAVIFAINQLKLTEIAHFTAAVQLGRPPAYACYMELKEHLPESVKQEFLRFFEHSLQQQNPEYLDKRSSKRLGPPVLKIVPVGTYTKSRQVRVHEGAPETQIKFPFLDCRSDFAGTLASINVFPQASVELAVMPSGVQLTGSLT